MNDHEIFMTLIKSNISEMQDTIDSLYVSCNSCAKNILLNRMRKNMSNLTILVQGLQNSSSASVGTSTYNPKQNSTRVFTTTDLAKYNGKDGNLAYVAVNGTVYDVTNSAAWAAATHFGLTAGKDLTNEFASCHTGQPVLSRLKVVGMMA